MTSGDPQFDAAVDRIKADQGALLKRKQADYGPYNIARAPGGPVVGLAVRLYDKISRLANLQSKDVDPQFETLVDTADDIANYGTILRMVLEGDWPGTDNYREQDAGPPAWATEDPPAEEKQAPPRHPHPPRFRAREKVTLAPGYSDGGATWGTGQPVSDDLQLKPGAVGTVRFAEPDDGGDLELEIPGSEFMAYAKPDRLVRFRVSLDDATPAEWDQATRNVRAIHPSAAEPHAIRTAVSNLLRATLYQAQQAERSRYETAADQTEALLRWYDVTPKV